jgi:hypothetical protein
MLTRQLNAFLLGNHLKLLSQRSHRGGFLWEVEKLRSECRRQSREGPFQPISRSYGPVVNADV